MIIVYTYRYDGRAILIAEKWCKQITVVRTTKNTDRWASAIIYTITKTTYYYCMH